MFGGTHTQLLSQTTTSYDSRGRAYQSSTYAVEPDLAPGLIKDEDEASYPNEIWQTDYVSGAFGYDYRYHAAGSAQDIATWTFEVDPTKHYQVLISWPQISGAATNAPFTVFNGTTQMGSVHPINQQNAPDDVDLDYQSWESLGFFQASTGTLIVQLTANANGLVIADAVRIQEVSLTGESLTSNVWYDKAGRVIKQQAAGSETFTKMTYDGLGRPVAQNVAYDANETTSDLYLGTNLNLSDDTIYKQTEYAYDNASNVILVTTRQNDNDSLTGTLNINNSRSTFMAYWQDVLGRQTATADYGTNGGITLTRPAMAPAVNSENILVSKTEYAYTDTNGDNRPEYVTKSSMSTSTGSTRADWTIYDVAGRVTKTIQNYLDGTYSAGAPNVDIVTTLDYNPAGQLWKQTDTLDNVTEFFYDGLGRLETRIDPDPDGTGEQNPLPSPTTSYSYNNLGEVLTTILSDTGTPATLTRETTYTYDKLGRQVTVTQEDPDGPDESGIAPSTTTGYDVRGNVHTVTDALGHATTYMYDKWNRLAEQRDANQTDPNNIKSTIYTYYDTGAMESLTDPEENTTTWTYDRLNRMTQETNELGEPRLYTYSGGLLARMVDRENRVTQYGYDRFGRQSEEYWYNDLSSVPSQTDPTGNDPAYKVYTYSYDRLGNLDKVFDGSNQNFTYDYDYDALSRATTIKQNLPGLTPQIEYTQTFDGNGNRKSLSAKIGDANDFQNAYQYDDLSRMTSVSQGSNVGNAVAPKLATFGYKSDGQFREIKRYADLTGSAWVATGAYDYDDAGRLTDLTYTFPPGSSSAPAYTWQWDEGNRITQFTSLLDAPSGYAAVNYNYDATNQLATVGTTPAADYVNWASWTNLADAEENYTYDENGNRIEVNGIAWGVGGDNQMASSVDGATTYKYLYDDEGIRTERYVDANANGELDDGDTDVTQYTWDHRNRLAAVKFFEDYDAYHSEGELDPQVSSWSVKYDYDYQNRLLHRTYDSDGDTGTEDVEQTAYVYDGNQIALQFEKTGSGSLAAGNLAYRYLYGPAIDQILADEAVSSGQTRWTLTDNLNSVRDLATYDGVTTSVFDHRVFDAFGVLKTETNPSNYHQPTNVDCHIYYTGKLYDDVTQLQNNINRWYEPTTGKWISEDPIGFYSEDVNLYRYSHNTPTSYTDPTGTIEWPSVTPPDGGVCTVKTDAGTSIPVYPCEDDEYDCHGYTFGGKDVPGGPYGIEPAQVPTILKDDNWTLIPCALAGKGDIIVWYDWRTREAVHSGVINSLDLKFGQKTTTVTSKCGYGGPFEPNLTVQDLQEKYGGFYSCYTKKPPKDPGVYPRFPNESGKDQKPMGFPDCDTLDYPGRKNPEPAPSSPQPTECPTARPRRPRRCFGRR